MPDAGRHISDIVGLATLHGQVWFARSITRPPTAVVQLCIGKPLISAQCSGMLAGNAEPHGSFGMIPRVGMAALEPRYLTRGPLAGEQKVHAGSQPLSRIRPNTQQRRVHAATSTGLVKYKTTLLPITGLSKASKARVSQGRLIKSQTRSL